MKYILDKSSGKPIYISLYEQLRKDIVSGVYRKGEKLMSKRLVAGEAGVSVITVEHAYMLLLDEGYIEARQRSGYFVIYSESENFGVSEEKEVIYSHPHRDSTDFPFSNLAKVMRSVITEKGEELLVKSAPMGTEELRYAISRYLSRSRGIEVPFNRIIIGSGAEYIYGLVVELLGQDKLWGIENPSYMKIEQVYKAKGVEIEHLKLGSDGILSDELKKSKANVLHITPYRSFPSGVTATPSKKYEYLKWAEKRGAVIVEDDFESEFTILPKPVETLFSMSDKGNIIYINTFSKTISPALRVAYMVLPEPLLEQFEKKLSFYSCTVPTFEQYVIAKLITEGYFERHINSVRRRRRTEKQKKN